MQDICICFLVTYCELAGAGLPKIFPQQNTSVREYLGFSVFVGT